MTITTTKTAGSYDPATVIARYVKYDQDGSFHWIETAPGRQGWIWDVRQGTCLFDHLPVLVGAAAIQRRREGVWPFYVEWKL